MLLVRRNNKAIGLMTGVLFLVAKSLNLEDDLVRWERDFSRRRDVVYSVFNLRQIFGNKVPLI